MSRPPERFKRFTLSQEKFQQDVKAASTRVAVSISKTAKTLQEWAREDLAPAVTFYFNKQPLTEWHGFYKSEQGIFYFVPGFYELRILEELARQNKMDLTQLAKTLSAELPDEIICASANLTPLQPNKIWVRQFSEQEQNSQEVLQEKADTYQVGDMIGLYNTDAERWDFYYQYQDKQYAPVYLQNRLEKAAFYESLPQSSTLSMDPQLAQLQKFTYAHYLLPKAATLFAGDTLSRFLVECKPQNGPLEDDSRRELLRAGALDSSGELAATSWWSRLNCCK